MKAAIKEKKAIYYIDSSNMIKFITSNSTMKHDDVCDFVRDKNICDGEYGPSYWEKSYLIKNQSSYNKDQIYWISAFFEAHPWIERMMIVFNN